MFGDDSVAESFPDITSVAEVPFHSTPIKESPFKKPIRPVRVTARVEPSSLIKHDLPDTSQTGARTKGGRLQPSSPTSVTQTPSYMQKIQTPYKLGRSSPGSDETTVVSQRKEIQLLVKELRDRDTELNETVAAHSQQLLAWERDRQRLLTLEQKCARYQDELETKKQNLGHVTLKLKAAQKQVDTSHQSLMNSTQEKLEKLTHERQQTSVQVDHLEKQNHSLNDSLKAMSGTVGQLQAQKQELITLLQLKEQEITQTANTILELNSRVQQMDQQCKESQMREADVLHRATQWKQKYTHSQNENQKLADFLQKKDGELDSREKQVGQIQHQLEEARQQLVINNERERSKDELLYSMRSKQERTLSQLRSVRELYERQQREITLMQLNLDSSKGNSNHNSHGENSLSVEEVVSYHDNPPVQQVETINSQQISFEEQLSAFLEQDTDTQAVFKHADAASPASRLQRLLTESHNMIESLEKSTVPVTCNQDIQESTGPMSRSWPIPFQDCGERSSMFAEQNKSWEEKAIKMRTMPIHYRREMFQNALDERKLSQRSLEEKQRSWHSLKERERSQNSLEERERSQHSLDERERSQHSLEERERSQNSSEEGRMSLHSFEVRERSQHSLEERGRSQQCLEERERSQHSLEERERERSQQSFEEGRMLLHSLEVRERSHHSLEEGRRPLHFLQERERSHHSWDEGRRSQHSLEERDRSHHSLEEGRGSQHSLEERDRSHHSREEGRRSLHFLEERDRSHHTSEEGRRSQHSLEEGQGSQHSLEEREKSHHSREEGRRSQHFLEERDRSHHSLEERDRSHHSWEEGQRPLHSLEERDRSQQSSKQIQNQSWSSSSRNIQIQHQEGFMQQVSPKDSFNDLEAAEILRRQVDD